MSNEREVLTPGGQTRVVTEADKQAADAIIARAEKKARYARILERGFLVDRLSVELPADKHGEWAPADQVDRWLALGFENGAEFASKRGLHGAADGYVHVGDAVFVVCAKEDKELLDEARMEQYIATHGSPQQKAELKQKEEKDFESRLHAEARELPVVEEGSAKAARREELRDAIKATGTNAVPSLTTK